MKKLIVIVLLLIIICTLTGCATKKITDEQGITRTMFARFITIESEDYVNDGGAMNTLHLCYDRETKIIYYLNVSYRTGFLSPFYIIVDGEPQIAIYGVNYSS